MASEWLYFQDGEQHGPCSSSHLKALVESGQVRGDAQIWKEGMGEWIPIHRVPRLAQASAVSPALSPPAPAVSPAFNTASPQTKRGGVGGKSAKSARPYAAGRDGVVWIVCLAAVIIEMWIGGFLVPPDSAVNAGSLAGAFVGGLGVTLLTGLIVLRIMVRLKGRTPFFARTWFAIGACLAVALLAFGQYRIRNVERLAGTGQGALPLTDQQMKAAAKQQADTCAQAVVRGDYDAFVAWMPPKAIEAIGGKAKLIRTMQDGDKEMKSKGAQMRSAKIGDVMQLRKGKSEAFAILPEFLEMSIGGGILQTESFLLGVSADGGRTWTYIDGAGARTAGSQLRAMFPNLPSDLVLPQKKESVFVAAASADPTLEKKSDAESPPMEVERSDYKIKVPAGCMVDPASPDIDSDHYTVVNLPGGDTLMIAVVDLKDKDMVDVQFHAMMQSFKEKLQDTSETKSDLFDARHGKGAILSGKLNGMQFCFEGGVFAGEQKSFVIVGTYQKLHSVEKRKVLQQCVASFVLK